MNFKDILIWLTIFVVGSLIVSFILSPNLASNFIESIKSNSKISSISSEDFPCISSFEEYIKIKEMRGYDLNLIETKEFNDKQILKDYLEKWGGEGQADVYISQQKVNDMNMPVDVALMHVKKCVNYDCGEWFEWGICKEDEFESILNLGW